MIHPVRFTLHGVAVIAFLASCGGSSRQAVNQADSTNTDTVAFEKHTLTRDFISEGVAVGDVNRDGNIDVMAGGYWFEAPQWKQHEVYAPLKKYDPAKEYCDSFLNFGMDVNGDDWVDLIIIDFPGKVAHWYENPRNAGEVWKKHLIHPSVDVGNESPNFVDVDGDGRTDILCADSREKQMIWLSPPSAGDTTWTRHAISDKNVPGTDRFSHGLGYGDINKDGRNDLVIRQGWWEAPANPKQSGWTFHPADLGEDCSHMHVLDVNGDGLNDVVSASAHHFGIWWHEQTRDDAGTETWKEHEISKAFSQSHSSFLTDLNGDGHPDLISGKRFFAHNDTDHDPGTHDPAVLYWFEYTPGKEPYFLPHLIDSDSGSGLNLVAQDITKDGGVDIVISNKKGVFVFERVRI